MVFEKPSQDEVCVVCGQTVPVDKPSDYTENELRNHRATSFNLSLVSSNNPDSSSDLSTPGSVAHFDLYNIPKSLPQPPYISSDTEMLQTQSMSEFEALTRNYLSMLANDSTNVSLSSTSSNNPDSSSDLPSPSSVAHFPDLYNIPKLLPQPPYISSDTKMLQAQSMSEFEALRRNYLSMLANNPTNVSLSSASSNDPDSSSDLPSPSSVAHRPDLCNIPKSLPQPPYISSDTKMLQTQSMSEFEALTRKYLSMLDNPTNDALSPASDNVFPTQPPEFMRKEGEPVYGPPESPYADIPTSPLLAIDTSWDDLLTSPLSDSIGTPIIDEFEWPDGLFIDNEDVLNVALTSGG
ncbi:hypothetical protein C8R41DRAFT_460251 [Lentinula lateritia]|uniref:Uncharacterized protein n=1 Tax=Lentinula lateritia TaxID=40482 RepID=A0ABQ8V9V7_9AGAR|nr:hypothetical protein C8R41DRAFT_460251 [Lentinula lateritia]